MGVLFVILQPTVPHVLQDFYFFQILVVMLQRHRICKDIPVRLLAMPVITQLIIFANVFYNY